MPVPDFSDFPEKVLKPAWAMMKPIVWPLVFLLAGYVAAKFGISLPVVDPTIQWLGGGP